MGPVARAFLVAALALCTAPSRAGTTVESVRKAGVLRCGIDRSEAEFSMTDEHGARLAFDQDFCKAVAVAVLGPTAKVEVKTYPGDRTSLDALKAGAVDLIASVSLDFSHATTAGVSFTRPLLYDGQALMVPLTAHIDSPARLAKKTVCFLDETEGAESVRAWFAARHVDFWPYPFQEQGEMEAAFITGNCAALAGDWTRLAVTRASFGARAAEFAILPERLSKDPLAAAFRSPDEPWGRVIQWTLEALIQAEESSVTSATVDKLQSSADPDIRRLLGASHELGAPLGLPPNWAANVIRAVGNYAEIYDRDLGPASPLKMPRGQNALSSRGGLMEALPLK